MRAPSRCRTGMRTPFLDGNVARPWARSLSLPAPACARTSAEDVDCVAVGEPMVPADALAGEPGRAPPETGAAAPGAQLVVDRVGHVRHGDRWRQSQRLAVHLALVPQEDPRQTGQPPAGLAERV